jgi:hypothetical protein
LNRIFVVVVVVVVVAGSITTTTTTTGSMIKIDERECSGITGNSQ